MEEDEGDMDPDDPRNEAYRHLLEVSFRWLTHCISNCATAEKAQGKGLTTWEIRIAKGGPKEIEWAERKVGLMLVELGLGEGRVGVDEYGETRLRCLKFVLDK